MSIRDDLFGIPYSFLVVTQYHILGLTLSTPRLVHYSSHLFMVRRQWLRLMVVVYQVGVVSHSHSPPLSSPLSRLWTLYSVRFRISRGVLETRNIITEHREGREMYMR